MPRKNKFNYDVHMYVTKDGMMRLLADLEGIDVDGSLLVRGSGANNSMISVWITQAQHDKLVHGDLTVRYR